MTEPIRGFVLEPGSHTVPDLIDAVASFLDYNIIYSEPELAGVGEIRITRRTEVDKQGCWTLFGALLYHKSLAILTLDATAGFYEVIARNGQRGRELANGARFVPIEEVESFADQKAITILTTVPLRNINATIATNALRPFFASSATSSSGITLGNVGNSSAMLVTGFGPEVAAACRLLRLIDVGTDKVDEATRVVRLEHADAAEIAACLNQLSEKRAQRRFQLVQETGAAWARAREWASHSGPWSSRRSTP